jgi:hypothetical protein
MTSTHTSFAAWRAPARLPSAALLQIASTFAFALAASVGAALITDLHSATAAATAAELGTPLEVVLADVDAVPVSVDAGVELVAAVELLVEELPLPHPATNTLPTIATTNHLDLCLIICAPRSIDKDASRRLLRLRPARASQQRYTRARIPRGL